ncbi:MAG: prephenate dehydrogenase/arogenate dehydrogenase family protein [Verrucomicrobia bacterium]|nr:prephenate dehydrogenase/arogenate dehydrogenase family protein [Verrucomicrobiota bacterium]
MTWSKVAVLGLGLLGGSIGLTLKKGNFSGLVSAYARRAQTVDDGFRLGVADVISSEIDSVVESADIIVLCTPVFQMKDLVASIGPGAIKPGAIVTDVGSVKGAVIDQLESLVHEAGAYFVGSHPMAGSEKTGVTAASAGLFCGSTCVVTPTDRTEERALESVIDFWRFLGCEVLSLSASFHDEFVGRCSHLPHILSSVLAHYVLSPQWPKEQSQLCSSGFRDTSRLASGSPEMWRDICLSNRQAILAAIADCTDQLNQFRSMLDSHDDTQIFQYFNTAKQQRDAWQKSTNPTKNKR